MVTTVPTPPYLESIVASIQRDGLVHEHLCYLLFSIVDHFCAQLPPRQGPGRHPTYSSALILKLDLLMHLTGKDGETEILREAARHYRTFFPVLPDQSRLWHRIRAEVSLLERFRRHLRTQLGVAHENLRILDTFPIAVAMPHSRRGKGSRFNLAVGGYCASKKLKYLGFKVGMVLTPQGIPDSYDLFPAKYMDVELLDDLLAGAQDLFVLGDKGFISKRKRETLLQTQNVRLITYRRKNQRVQATPLEHWLLATFRQTIETVFSQLDGHMHMEHCGAKSDLGLVKRIVGITTAFTLGIYLNALLGRPLLAIKELFA
jgi:hypothetical protein